MDSILDFEQKYEEKDDIKSYEYLEYYPTSGSNLNMPGQITITIENQDEFYHPRRSWLLFEGDLLKKNGERYEDKDMITLTNNGILYLFGNMKYELAGGETEYLNHPGPATTMLGMAKYPIGYGEGPGLMQCWFSDSSEGAANTNKGFNARHSYIIMESNPKGSFSFAINLDHIFGFTEDYDGIVYGMRHSLQMVRKSDDNDAIFKAANAAEGKVVLSKISWMMPHVQPNDILKFDLYKKIEEEAIIDARFRMRQCYIAEIPKDCSSYDWRLGVRSATEKPRHVLVAFQQNNFGSQNKNASVFHNIGVKKMKVILNDTEYPLRDITQDFPKCHFVQYYKAFIDFARDYYGIDPLNGNNSVDPANFLERYPIFYFDISKQSERLNQSVVDMRVKMEFSENVGKNVRAYAVIISDRRMKFQSSGKKMSVVY